MSRDGAPTAPSVASAGRGGHLAASGGPFSVPGLPGRDGGPTEPEVLDRAWRLAQKRAGAIHRPLHSLRHYAISTWIRAGLNVKVVQAMAGHASVTTTFNRYGHLFPDDLELAAARLADTTRAARTDFGPTREVGTDAPSA